MNKKGFTLIEVVVSVVLVSIVMVTLTSTLVELKKKSEVVATNTEAIIYSSIISRVINSDLALNEGIKYIECSPNGDECGLVLGNNNKRSLVIKDVSDTTRGQVVYNNATGNYYISENTPSNKYVNRVELINYSPATVVSCPNNSIPYNCLAVVVKSNGSCSCFKERISTTLVYRDISADRTSNIVNTNGNVKYVKTLSYDKTTNLDENSIATKGYGFSRMYYKQDTYTGNSEKSVLTRLVIGIYDGIDKNDETYNVSLYSAARIGDGSPNVGDVYSIKLDTRGNLSSAHGIVVPQMKSDTLDDFYYPLTSIKEIFNIGFQVVNQSEEPGSNTGEVQTFNGFDRIPCIGDSCPDSSVNIFKGYYTENSSDSTCHGTMVINGEGRFTVAPNYFTSDGTIYACWE